MRAFILLSLATLAVAEDPFPDTADECQPASVQPNWPTYHIVNNVTLHADGSATMEPLNDANAIFLYRGIWHVMNQAGGGNWTHAISDDLAHWYHINDALGRNRSSSWDYSGPCDGTASFPNLGYGPFDGSTPVIMYGPDCGQPVGPSSNDAPRVEPALPADPSDPFLREWIKTPNGPVKFDGTPCSFPGRVWKSRKGNYWNMLCALDGKAPWARYTTTDPKLMSWRLAAESFTSGVDKGAAAGALFHKIPGAPRNGPQYMINSNTGTAFYLGEYDHDSETFQVRTPLQVIEHGHAYHWAASGNDGPDPETDTGRLLTVAWVSNRPSVLSLIRDMKFDAETQQLVSQPIPEYALLRNATFVQDKTMAVSAGSTVTLPVPPAAGGAADIAASFNVDGPASKFGIAVRAPAAGIDGAAFRVSFNISAPSTDGSKTLQVTFNADKPIPIKVLSGETVDVRVLVDRPVVEAFVMGGRAAYVFADTTFSKSKTTVHLFNQGSTTVSAQNVNAYGMGCGWARHAPKPAQSLIV